MSETEIAPLLDEIDGLLTPMQRKVLACLSEGLDGEETSIKLGISVHTVKIHKKEIYRRLGARNAPHAVLRATEEGLINVAVNQAFVLDLINNVEKEVRAAILQKFDQC